MKPNLLKSSSSQTLVLEKEVKEQEVKKEEKLETPVAPKQEVFIKPESKQVHLENKKSLFNAFSADFEQKQEKQAYIMQENVEEEIKPQQNEDVESDALVDFKTKVQPKKKKSGFRFKLIIAIYAVVLGITVGWVGANAVRISQVQNMIHAQDVKYVQKIAELDKLKEKQDENNQLIPWDELLPVQQLPLEDVTEYEKESNWFDNIVNWFGKLFGG